MQPLLLFCHGSALQDTDRQPSKRMTDSLSLAWCRTCQGTGSTPMSPNRTSTASNAPSFLQLTRERELQGTSFLILNLCQLIWSTNKCIYFLVPKNQHSEPTQCIYRCIRSVLPARVLMTLPRTEGTPHRMSGPPGYC